MMQVNWTRRYLIVEEFIVLFVVCLVLHYTPIISTNTLKWSSLFKNINAKSLYVGHSVFFSGSSQAYKISFWNGPKLEQSLWKFKKSSTIVLASFLHFLFIPSVDVWVKCIQYWVSYNAWSARLRLEIFDIIIVGRMGVEFVFYLLRPLHFWFTLLYFS